LHIPLRRERRLIERKNVQPFDRIEHSIARGRRGRKRSTGIRTLAPLLPLLNERFDPGVVHDRLATG
jgi:hypothetical protein